MYGYAAGAATATTTLPPFNSPRQTANEAGLSTQNAAVVRAVDTAAGVAFTGRFGGAVDN